MRALMVRRRMVRLRPLTLELYLDVLHAVGADAKTLGASDFDAAEAPLDACVRLCDLMLDTPPERYRPEGARRIASQLWEAFLTLAALDGARARDKVEAVEESMGEFLPEADPVTLERVIYAFEPAGVEVLLGWPLWRVLEYTGVRAVEAAYRETEMRLAKRN